MRLLMGVHGLPPASLGGTERAALTLARGLAGRLEVVLFYPLTGPGHRAGDERRYREQGVLRVGRALPKPTTFQQTFDQPAAVAWFEELLERYRPDVVHLHHLTGLSTRLPALAAARNIPSILTLHDYWLPCARGQLMDLALEPCPGPEAARCATCLLDQIALERVEGRLLRRLFSTVRPPETWLEPFRRWYSRAKAPDGAPDGFAQARAQTRIDAAFGALASSTLLAAPSRHLLEGYTRLGVDPAKMRFVDHGFAARGLRPASPPPAPLHVGFVGALIPTKGVHRLLDAYEQLPRDRIRLTLVGPAPPFHRRPEYAPALQERARRLGVAVVGAVPPEAVRGWLERFHVLALPSIWPENAPLVIGEAFLAGVPVVASDIGGIPERVLEGVNGRLFPAGDAGALARVLETLIESPGLVTALREGAWRTGLPALEAHVDQYVRLYEEARGLATPARSGDVPRAGAHERPERPGAAKKIAVPAPRA